MDFTASYIEMCEKAEEIQRAWIPATGDFYWMGTEYIRCPESCRVLCEDPIRFTYWHKEGKIWLPRQDQLQEMCREKGKQLWESFYRYLNRNQHAKHLDSPEKLWLTFTMLESFGKTWDARKKNWLA